MIYWIQIAATWAMIGAVWFVLVVHYPAVKFAREHFTAFEKFHIRRTVWLVAPIMTIEGITAILLLLYSRQPLLVANVFLLSLIWLFTFAGCYPSHSELKEGYSTATFHRLMRFHLLRVGLWTLRGILLFFVKIHS